MRCVKAKVAKVVGSWRKFVACAPLALLCANGLLCPSVAQATVWPSVIEKVERQLGAEDIGTRRQAAERLLQLPASAVRRLLPRVLADVDAEVRIVGASAAIQVQFADTERVIPWLTDADPRLRRAAAELLEMSPNSRAISHLARIVGDPDPAVRAASARALASSGDPQAASALLGRIDDPDPRVRESVTDALAELGDQRAVVPLIGKVQDSRATVRRGVLRALGRLGDLRAASAILLALHDSEADVQVAALEALGELKAEAAVTAIVPLVRSSGKDEVVAAALFALAAIRSDDALAALVDIAVAPDEELAEAARSALELTGEAALPKLERCLTGQPVQEVLDRCVLSLARIQSERATKILLDAVGRRLVSPEVSLEVLARAPGEAALVIVLEYLAADDILVRKKAILAALALFNPARADGRAVEPVARALAAASRDPEEQAQLITLLGRTGSPRAAASLAPFIGLEGVSRARLAAIEAVGLLHVSNSARLLLPALDDDSAAVRLAAATSLRRLGDASVASALLDRFHAAEALDRTSLCLALAGALRNVESKAVLDRVVKLIVASRGAVQDALIEALAENRSRYGSARLLALRTQLPDHKTAAKIAEGLALHPEQKVEILRLTSFPADGVRMNAVWSLGAIATLDDIGHLTRLLRDENHGVAANAAAAFGRILWRSKGATPHHGGQAEPAREPADSAAGIANVLCGALSDARVYVRVNALAALRLGQLRCRDGSDQRALTEDRSAAVRAAGAALIRDVSSDAVRDQSLLARCRASERDGRVALECSTIPNRSKNTDTAAVAVFVLPPNGSEPAPGAAYALRRADGLVRLGEADRRGALFEYDAPLDELRLLVPAPFVAND